MFSKKWILILLLAAGSSPIIAQNCTALGQNPSTAFPVCGTSVFKQSSVPICGNTKIDVPCSDNGIYNNKNPFWYKFTCFEGGTLGFLIKPDVLSDDYDWQLFDITGKNPDDVFTDKKLFVACNWSGESGLTGASAAGNGFISCSGPGQPLFSKMPTLVKGHEYLLLVSHFTDTQSGYQLSFGGGTASITDTAAPALRTAVASCGGLSIGVKLSKKMKCSSLAANGSDFAVSPALGQVTAARGIGCQQGFDMDSVVLTMSNAIAPGNYQLLAQNGSDFNSILDNCGNDIPVASSVPFAVAPVAPTPLDSIVPLQCKPNEIELVMDDPINCNSIAADGSDFVLSGPAPVSIVAANGNCNGNATTMRIQLRLSVPITRGGGYTLTLQKGSDGNTIINECGQETPAGAALGFPAYDTVSAGFSYQILYGCKTDTVLFTHPGLNNVNEWLWTFDNSLTSQQQNPTQLYTRFGEHSVQLKVSNGVCSDSAEANLVLDNELKAEFSYPEFVCPEDLALLEDKSTGNIQSWNWDFGNGQYSQSPTPAGIKFNAPTASRQAQYRVQLIVENNLQCRDTAVHIVNAVNTCKIAVPNAFTPNNDGRNDYLYPLNAWKADNLIFRIYNRYGQVVFETRDWNRKWDGTIGGRMADPGVYVWILQYIDHDSQMPVLKKGTTVLIR